MHRIFYNIDLAIFLPVSFLVILGGLILMSVSPESFPRQFFYIGLAIFAFLLFSKIDIRILGAFSPWFYPLSILLLVTTLFIGGVTRGAVRWLELGPFTLQTSEIVKPFLLLFFSWFLTRESGNRRFFVSLPLILVAIFLILKQPDLGSSLVVFVGFLGAVFVAGVPLGLLIPAGLAALGGAPLLWQLLADYQKERVISFLAPQEDPLGAGYNAIQAIIAVGSGQLFGRGLGQGTQSQLAFLPERHTDFIFAALSEELGLLGALAVILAFLFLLWRIIGLLRAIREDFEKVFLGGAFLSIFFQAAVNIGMNLGLLPITGIPLPFVSSGGSSLLSLAIILGIIASLSRDLSQRRSLGIIGT